MEAQRLRGVAAGLVAVAIWAGWIVAVRGAVATFPPLDLAVLRYLGPVLLLAPVLLRCGPLPEGVSRWRIAAMTLGWGAPFALFAAEGLKVAETGLFGALVPGSMPLWLSALSLVALGARFRREALAGLALIGGAAALALWAAPPGTLGGAPWLVAASIAWAVYTLAYRGSGLTPLQATAVVGFWSLLLLAPLVAAQGVTLFTRPLTEVATQFALQGALAGVVAVAAFAEAVRSLGAARAAAFAALVPVTATLGGWAALGEPPSAAVLASVFLAGAGVAILNARPATIGV